MARPPQPGSAALNLSSNIHDLHPAAFSFTFYAPLGTSSAQDFHSDEPTVRTTTSIIRLDPELWGEEEGPGNKRLGAGDERDATRKLDEDHRAEREAKADSTGSQEDRRSSKRTRQKRTSSDGTGDDENRKKHKRKRSSSKGSSVSNVEESESHRISPPPNISSLPPPKPFPWPRQLKTSTVELMRYLSFDDFAPFLSMTRVSPSLSDEYASTLLRFCADVEPPFIWIDPNFRNNYDARVISDLSLRSLAFKTVAWIWDGTIYAEHLRWVVEDSPLPLFALVLEFIMVRRYLQAVHHTVDRFRLYLSSSPVDSLSPRALRAKLLVNWLDQGGQSRWERFFSAELQSSSTAWGRREEVWEPWFAHLGSGGTGKEATIEDLDEWDRKLIEKENE